MVRELIEGQEAVARTARSVPLLAGEGERPAHARPAHAAPQYPREERLDAEEPAQEVK
jgi:hypothetical protein